MRYAIWTDCDWERVVICNGNLLTCDMCYLGKKSQNKLIHPHCPQCWQFLFPQCWKSLCTGACSVSLPNKQSLLHHSPLLWYWHRCYIYDPGFLGLSHSVNQNEPVSAHSYQSVWIRTLFVQAKLYLATGWILVVIENVISWLRNNSIMNKYIKIISTNVISAVAYQWPCAISIAVIPPRSVYINTKLLCHVRFIFHISVGLNDLPL